LQHVLQDSDAHGLAMILVLVAYAGLLAQALFIVLGLPYVFLVWHGMCYGHQTLTWPVKAAIVSFIIAIVVTLIFHLGANWFVSSRFVLLLALILMLYIPFSLSEIFNNWRSDKNKWYGKTYFCVLVFFGLLYTLIAGLGHFGPSKSFMIESGHWVSENLPSHAKILTNSSQFQFYSNFDRVKKSTGDEFLMALKKANDYDAIVVYIPKKKSHEINMYQALIEKSPTRVFKNKRGDAIYLFLRTDLNNPLQ
jgi:hypothetical protein